MSGLSEDALRRVSAALDADGDEALARLLEEEPEARGYAEDLQAIDGALRGLSARVGEPDWDAMAAAIDARLEADALELERDLDDLDVTAPPELADDEPRVAVFAPPPAIDEAAPAPSVGGVVSLEAARRRRRTFAWIGGLAAAAAVGLGITAGMSMNDAPAAMEAAAPAAFEPAAELAAAADEEEETIGAMATAAPGAPPADSADDYAPEAEPALEPTEEPAEALARAEPEASAGIGGLDNGYGGAINDLLGASAGEDPGASPEERALRRARGRVSTARPAAAPMAARSISGGGSGARAGGGAMTTPASAMRAVEPAVQRCLADRGVVAGVTVEVDGTSGRVLSAVVTPSLGATDACVVAAVRGARLPPSSSGASSYRYSYTFRPAPTAGGSMTGTSAPAARSRRAAPPAAAPATRTVDELAE